MKRIIKATILGLLCLSCQGDPAAEYQNILSKIQSERLELAASLTAADAESGRQAIIHDARVFFLRSVCDDILPCWYGTDWDYNGTTEHPGQGGIACGYFVTTVLAHAGVALERVRLAQQASEVMIKALTSERFIRRFSDVPIEEFVAAIEEWGEGLYVVGLDIHTGFVTNVNDRVSFVHSSYVKPHCVVKEDARTSPILLSSRYRVLAKLSDDDELIEGWLNSQQYNER